jgi:hypothetical protein
LFGFLCALGIRGGIILGITAADILTSYWNFRYNSSYPPKIYAFNRRIHHGEIGALLALSSLFLRTTPAASVAAILTGIGIGLVKDDCADIMEWFRLKKKETERDQDQQKEEKAILETETAINEHSLDIVTDIEERPGNLSTKTTPSHHESKGISEQINLERLQKQIRSLIDMQSQTAKEIELQIKRSRRMYRQIQ